LFGENFSSSVYSPFFHPNVFSSAVFVRFFFIHEDRVPRRRGIAESENLLPKSVPEEGGENRDQIRDKICRSISNFSISFEFCLTFFLSGLNKRWCYGVELERSSSSGKHRRLPHPTSMCREKERIHDISGTWQSDFLYQQFWSSLV
jgi:hypothetical protein